MKIQVNPTLVLDKTIREVERINYAVTVRRDLKAYDENLAAAAVWMWRQIRFYRYTDAGENLTVANVLKTASWVRMEFIQQHRINYMAWFAARGFYDWLEEKKRLTYDINRYWRHCERCFADYQREHRSTLDQSTWSTVQDHMNIANNAISYEKEQLFPVIRDYMIQHRSQMTGAGQKDDIEILHRIMVCFIFFSATANTYRHFFLDVSKKYGVDFSWEFRYADLQKLRLNFSRMCEAMGVRICKDKDGEDTLVGINVEDSVRIESAWNAIVAIVTDSDIMDKTAEDAINMNAELREDYAETLAKAEREALEDGMKQLSDKYKVTVNHE